jgi:peroxiredoxin
MRYFFILLIALSFFIRAQESEITGKKAPDFKLQDINGNYVELKKLVGNGPILLSFWATWCKPCIEELTEYKKIYEDFKSENFQVIAISTDNEKTVAKVKPFVKSKNYPFTVLLDTNSDIARKYYAQAVPYSVLLDEKGNIVYTHIGYMKGDELNLKKKLEELITD